MEGGEHYSQAGLQAVHPRLENLLPLYPTQEEQLREARLRADKMSIQGGGPSFPLPTGILDPVLHTLDSCRDAWERKIENS